MKRKVLFIVSSLEVGGIETYLLRFLTMFSGEMHPIVLCRGGARGVLATDYEGLGVQVNSKDINFFSIRGYIWLYSYLKKNNFDAICDFSGDFAGFVLFLANSLGVKTRISFYRESEYQFRKSISKLIYVTVSNILVKKNATVVLSNSKVALNNFHPEWALGGNKYKVINNGIPFIKTSDDNRIAFRRQLKIPKKSVIIGHIGRYVPAKNHSYIISLVDSIVEKYPNVYFLLCGKGVEEAVNRTTGDCTYKEHIITPGVCKDLTSFFSTIDLFVFPSINEGQPNALLEAMISKTPVIANSIESVKEVVPDEAAIALFDGTANDFHNKIQTFLSMSKSEKLYDYCLVSDKVRKNHSPEVRFRDFLSELNI